MHTQCPDCKTKFLINDDQLRVAQGKVRCSKCHKVFNALESLQTPPKTTASSIEPPPAMPETVTDFMSDADLEEFTELKAKISNDLSSKQTSKTDTPDTSPKKEQEKGPEIDDDLSEVLQELERFEKANAAPQEIKQDITEPEQQVDDDARAASKPIRDPLEILTPKRPLKKKGGALWALGILLLLTVSLVQLAWFERAKLMYYPEGRMLLQAACGYIGCELPAIRAPEKIQVLSRSITMHPKIEDALLIQLTIANKASFAQPLPLLQISLFSSDEILVVQRRFKPSEYLADSIGMTSMSPGKAIYVELAIKDPGNEVTGFKLDFF